MTMTEQRQRYLRARVALALYSEYGHVPKEAEIDRVYHLSRVLYTALLGTHYLRKQQKKSGQLVLFIRTCLAEKCSGSMSYTPSHEHYLSKQSL